MMTQVKAKIDEIDFQVSPERECIKHTLIGSAKAVTSTIRVLHQLRYADIVKM